MSLWSETGKILLYIKNKTGKCELSGKSALFWHLGKLQYFVKLKVKGIWFLNVIFYEYTLFGDSFLKRVYPEYQLRSWED